MHHDCPEASGGSNYWPGWRNFAVSYTPPVRSGEAQMVKAPVLNVRFTPATRAALEAAAAADGRSLSGMAERIVSVWLTEHGYLKAPKKRR